MLNGRGFSHQVGTVEFTSMRWIKSKKNDFLSKNFSMTRKSMSAQVWQRRMKYYLLTYIDRNSVTESHFKKKNYADDQWKKEIADNAG